MTQRTGLLPLDDITARDLVAPTRKSHRRKKLVPWQDDESAEDAYARKARAYGLPPVVPQFKLEKSEQEPRKDGKDIPRQWRFDFCFVEYKVIVEIDGGIWRPGGGAHSHPVDLRRNMEKRNDAALAGFVILAFTPEEIRRKNNPAIAFTMRVLGARGWKSPLED